MVLTEAVPIHIPPIVHKGFFSTSSLFFDENELFMIILFIQKYMQKCTLYRNRELSLTFVYWLYIHSSHLAKH